MAKKKRNKAKQANREPEGTARAATPDQGPTSKKPQEPGANPTRRPPFDARMLVLGLAILGSVLTAYLTGVKWAEGELLACAAGEGCDIVMSSRWSTLLGMPIAAWGCLTYVLISALVWRSKKRPAAWTHAMFIAGIGVAISLYLQAMSVFVIEALCPYCIVSAVLITTVFVLLCVFRPRSRLDDFNWVSFAPATAIIAAALVVGMHLHFSGSFDATQGPEDAYLKGLAVHLDDSGAKFYGAFWCPHCNRQKELFGASVKRLPYVECSPNGRTGPRNPACTVAAVRSFPTWIIGGRRVTGIQEPKQLARLSGYKG
jgi:uncharacterized membrane protein